MTDSKQDKLELARTIWRSRRGLLELDLLLLPFSKCCYSRLAPEEKNTYQRLLEENDMDILAWLNGAKQPGDADVAHLVGKIIQYATSGNN